MFFRVCTLLALCFGVYMSACRHVATSKIWWLIGLASFCALYYLPTWQGFTGTVLFIITLVFLYPLGLKEHSYYTPTT